MKTLLALFAVLSTPAWSALSEVEARAIAASKKCYQVKGKTDATLCYDILYSNESISDKNAVAYRKLRLGQGVDIVANYGKVEDSKAFVPVQERSQIMRQYLETLLKKGASDIRERDLRSLTAMQLDYQGEEFPASDLQGLVGLTTLGISNAQISNWTQESIPAKSLRTLTLSGISSTSMDPNLFAKFPSLRKLSLVDTAAANMLSASMLAPLKKLESLDLSRNSLVDFPLDILESVPSLKNLDIANNMISVFEENSVEALKKLKTLTLDSAQAQALAEALQGAPRLSIKKVQYQQGKADSFDVRFKSFLDMVREHILAQDPNAFAAPQPGESLEEGKGARELFLKEAMQWAVEADAREAQEAASSAQTQTKSK